MAAALPGARRGRAGGTLTFGAEAEVSGGRAMLVVDGASVRAAVHGGRLHDGQGRRPLVPCTAERGDPSCEGHTTPRQGQTAPQTPLREAAGNSGAGGTGAGPGSPGWSAVLTLTSCDLGQVTSEPRFPILSHGNAKLL